MERDVGRNYRGLIILAAFLALSGSARAQQSSPSDSLRPKGNSLVALPYAYYTPETKFAFGVGGVYSFRSPDGAATERPSSLRLAMTYTQLNQIILALQPEIYLMEGQYYFAAFYGYYHYPSKFWGVGNATPDSAEERYEQNDFESSTDAAEAGLARPQCRRALPVSEYGGEGCRAGRHASDWRDPGEQGRRRVGSRRRFQS